MELIKNFSASSPKLRNFCGSSRTVLRNYFGTFSGLLWNISGTGPKFFRDYFGSSPKLIQHIFESFKEPLKKFSKTSSWKILQVLSGISPAFSRTIPDFFSLELLRNLGFLRFFCRTHVLTCSLEILMHLCSSALENLCNFFGVFLQVSRNFFVFFPVLFSRTFTEYLEHHQNLSRTR